MKITSIKNGLCPNYKDKFNTRHNKNVNFKSNDNLHADSIEQTDKSFKKGALIGSLIGTTISSVIAIASVKNVKNIIPKILTTDFSNPKNLFMIASGSVLGGFSGSVIEDKGKNVWKKTKEGIFQMLSNVTLPLLFLSLLKNANEKLTKNAHKSVQKIGTFISVFTGVGIGAYTGAYIANKINKHIIKPEIPYERNLGVKDFLVHVDDLPLALASTGIPYIDKLIPLILVTRGYDVGKQ